MTENVRRKLIEVALPLEAINRESAREKSIRHGHPSTLHLWWARRPLAAARAVLFAQLVDDPSARPEEFPTEAEQDAERRRLFDLIERLVVWENAGDEKLLAEAHAEILASTNGNPPPTLDPFAGGGSIPLEAQRLGLEAHASDLNPVAVLINKALIEIPPKYAGQLPVFPGAADSKMHDWPRATGLAEDVRLYGHWMHKEAKKRIGHMYPQANLPDGSKANVIAWIWARTVTCPNPACGIAMPLARTFWLSKKKDCPTWAVPVVRNGQIHFEIATGNGAPVIDGTVGRQGASCVSCRTPVTLNHIRAEGQAKGLGTTLVAAVAEGAHQRFYLPADMIQEEAALVSRPDNVPDAHLPINPRDFKTPNYGMTTFGDLFTNRQLVALTTFSDLVGEVRDRAATDAKEAGLADDAESYANAIALYLAFTVDKFVDRNSSICTWEVGMNRLRGTFQRQAIPMTWDFAEANVFGGAGGDFGVTLVSEVEAIERLPAFSATDPVVTQVDAQLAQIAGKVVITDPPYYDNIGYADLSDFFYVWLRRSLSVIHQDITGTILTPKTEELVATPYRFGGSKKLAEEHFERGFIHTFTRIREQHPRDMPITIFYAFKQSESDANGTASTGWETMLNGLLKAGLMVTATWPMRTELSTRSIGRGANALASSIILACRPRPHAADATNRRGFIAALKAELPEALRRLLQGSVAPVDLAQAAIGPGMAVFTRYARVVEANGSDMAVRIALTLINQVLDETLAEQEGDFDTDTRFCIKWFGQYAWNDSDSGTADTLARATNTSLAGLQRGGIFRAVAGKARLTGPEELPEPWDPLTDERISVWEAALHITNALSKQGVEAAAALMATAGQRIDLDAVKELAYLLYSICERRGWTKSAVLFNALGTSWSDVDAAARAQTNMPATVQGSFEFDED